MVVHKASTARFDSSTGYRISNVHKWVDAIHESSEICIPCSFKVKLSITFVYLTRPYTPVFIFLHAYYVFLIIKHNS